MLPLLAGAGAEAPGPPLATTPEEFVALHSWAAAFIPDPLYCTTGGQPSSHLDYMDSWDCHPSASQWNRSFTASGNARFQYRENIGAYGNNNIYRHARANDPGMTVAFSATYTRPLTFIHMANYIGPATVGGTLRNMVMGSSVGNGEITKRPSSTERYKWGFSDPGIDVSPFPTVNLFLLWELQSNGVENLWMNGISQGSFSGGSNPSVTQFNMDYFGQCRHQYRGIGFFLYNGNFDAQEKADLLANAQNVWGTFDETP